MEKSYGDGNKFSTLYLVTLIPSCRVEMRQCTFSARLLWDQQGLMGDGASE